MSLDESRPPGWIKYFIENLKNNFYTSKVLLLAEAQHEHLRQCCWERKSEAKKH